MDPHCFKHDSDEQELRLRRLLRLLQLLRKDEKDESVLDIFHWLIARCDYFTYQTHHQPTHLKGGGLIMNVDILSEIAKARDRVWIFQPHLLQEPDVLINVENLDSDVDVRVLTTSWSSPMSHTLKKDGKMRKVRANDEASIPDHAMVVVDHQAVVGHLDSLDIFQKTWDRALFFSGRNPVPSRETFQAWDEEYRRNLIVNLPDLEEFLG